MLASVRTVIVDEIHAIADDKRGAHLALTLARLDRLVEQNGCPKPQRIGLSATVKPLEEVAAFLSDDARVIDVDTAVRWSWPVEVPRDELGAVATNEMWGEIYDRTADLIRANRTTLVFVNTRRLAERVAHHLTERPWRKRRPPASRQSVAQAAPGRRTAAQRGRTASGGWPPRHSNSASTSVRSISSARSARRDRSPWHYSV
ncbi:MAG: DEAD/DEAH box helicase [Ignavibacteriota bacterium]